MKKMFTLLSLCLFVLGSVYAQRTITGTIADDNGEALIGATVIVKGTTTGTATDIDGAFTITLPAGAETLVVSYTGYATQEVEITVSNAYDIELVPGIGLEEVIVVGYSEVPKKDLTGAVSSVGGDQLENIPTMDVQQALRGRAAGVFVNQNSGTPGSGIDVRVRGSTSITASNRPLYVIDGIPMIDASFSQTGVGNQGTNSMADLNPNDIESIEVLKDAATAAIYGSRAANGVVLITTKKGKAGRTKVGLNASYGFQDIPNKIEMLDREGYRSFLDEALGNPDVAAGALTGDTDWQDEIFRTGNLSDLNLTINGGDERTRFNGSLAYSDNQGAITGSRFQRYSARLNLDHVASDNLTFGMKMNYINTQNDRIQNDNNIFGALSVSLIGPPTVPIRNEDGTFGSAFGWENPVAATTIYDNLASTNRLIGKIFGRYEIIDNLKFEANMSVDALAFQEDVFEPSALQSSNNGTASYGEVTNVRLINEYILSYNKLMGNVSLRALGGVSFQKDNIDRVYAVVNDFPTDDFTGLTAGASLTSVTGSFSGDNLQSYFANVNLDINDKYLITATFRTDGSSRFVNDKWGYFPGVSAAWRLSEEDFLAGGAFDDLKLRVSYGLTGNNQIGNFDARQLYGGGSNYLDQPGITPTQLGNPDLRWESTAQFNVGLDFTVLRNRLSASIDFYNKTTDDLILNRPLPTTSGFTTVPQNIGEVRNTGVELAINSTNVSNNNFTWTTNFNIAYNENEVVTLFDGQPFDIGFASRVAEGQPLGSFYGYVTDGLFQNQAEIDAHATQPNAAPGDIRFADLNSDGVINDQDREFIGGAIPDFTGGMTNTLSYKGLTLDFFFQFVLGNEIYNNNGAFIEAMSNVFNTTQRAYEGAWREEGDDEDFPRVAWGDPNGNTRDSDRFAEDGSYLRLKTTTLAYEFPSSVIDGIGFSRLRIFVTGKNLLTFTDYSGFDPEVNTFDGSNTALGTDFLTFPQARSFAFGVNVGF